MIVYKGKAKHYNFKQLLYAAFWTLAHPIERLEPEDFNQNKN